MNKKLAAKTSSTTRKSENIYRNMSVEEIANLCDRMVILHTTGLYLPPDPKPRACENKNKRRKTLSGLTSHNNNVQKTTFGQGRIGVSCESYGVKNCVCCRPDLESGVVAKPISATVFNPDDLNCFTSDDDDVVIVDSYPNRKSPLLSITIYDDDDEPCTSTCVPVLGVLKADDVLEQGQSNPLIENVSKVEADPQEILDYVNLVTNDLNEKNLEEQFMKLIQDELEEEKNKPIKKENGNKNYLPTACSSNSAVNIPAPSIIEARDTANKKNISLPKQRKNISSVIEIIDSPANTPVNHSATNNLECPICLESFINREVMSTICGHLFCAGCIKYAIKQSKQCPNCRKKLSLKGIHPIFL